MVVVLGAVPPVQPDSKVLLRVVEYDRAGENQRLAGRPREGAVVGFEDHKSLDLAVVGIRDNSEKDFGAGNSLAAYSTPFTTIMPTVNLATRR